MRELKLLGAMLVGLVFTGGTLFAQRIIIRDPKGAFPKQIVLSEYSSEITVEECVAKEDIQLKFYNPNNWDAKGEFLMVINPKSQVDKFNVTIDGRQITAEVLDAKKAREFYERGDPALLAYYNWGLIKAATPPIKAKSHLEIRLRLSRILSMQEDIVRYVTLTIPRRQKDLVKKVSLQLDIKSRKAIKNIYSPTHPNINIARRDDHNVRIQFEEANYPAKAPFILYWSVSEQDFGLSLLTYREFQEKGFFILMLSPKIKIEDQEVMPKDVIFCFDTSSSMREGNKIEQARQALRFCIKELGPKDRFNIIDFNTDVNQFAEGLLLATETNIKKALSYIDNLKAKGLTATEDALVRSLEQFKDEQRPRMIVFMTDGMPTIGERDPDKLVKIIKDKNQKRCRIFVFGVGYDVNTRLLDMLATDNAGTCDYILPEEDVKDRIFGFFAKVSHPVLSEVTIEYGLKTEGVYPKVLPDIFKGQQLVILGRYDGSGRKTITLRGKIGQTKKVYKYEVTFPEESEEADFIPRLWAGKRIAFLLDEMRKRGEDKEIIEEIVKLAKRYGIVTPYTSFLVTEDRELIAKAPDMRFVGHLRARFKEDKDEGFAGKAQVELAKKLAELKGDAPGAAAQAPNVLDELAQKEYERNGRKGSVADKMRVIGSKTFYRIDGVWYDSTYNEGMKDRVQTVKFKSKEYFKLLSERPRIAKYLALGQEIVICLGKEIYKITR